jgi:hypothetical protein
MGFDQLQNTWQHQPIPDPITVKADILLRLTRRDQKDFLHAILRRDILEVAFLLLFAVVFLQIYLQTHNIAMLIITLGCLFVGAFLLVDRIIQKKRQPQYQDNLSSCLEGSLYAINHQIGLLRHIVWWYLLPIGIGLFAAIISPAWEQGIDHLVYGWKLLVLVVAVFYGVYRLNRHAVTYELIPRRNELLDLLHQLNPEHAGQTETEPTPPYTQARQLIDLCLVVLLNICFFAGIYSVVSSSISFWSNRQELDIDDFSNHTQRVTTLLSEPNQDKKPIIIEARYGYQRKWVDVTESVIDRVARNTHPILATNNLASDPCPGQVKSLVVHYVYQANQHTTRVQGIQPLLLPPAEDDP